MYSSLRGPKLSQILGRRVAQPSMLRSSAVLSAGTFCSFVREFSPLELGGGWAKMDTRAVGEGARPGWLSSRRRDRTGSRDLSRLSREGHLGTIAA